MAEAEKDTVTATHPATGATLQVTAERAEKLSASGWNIQRPIPRRVAPPDEPDVEAGRAKLAESTGEKPVPLHVTKTAKKAAKRTARKHAAGAKAAAAETEQAKTEPTEAEDPTSPDSETMKLESEAGHGGLQVDEGASNA